MGIALGDSNHTSRHDRETSQQRATERGVALYAGAIFASAFLIFLVQPMVGKRILPWFGGVPAVWTLCLSFYQATLFLGYAYAHLMIQFVDRRFQIWIHTALVAVALALLPVLPDAPGSALDDASPTRAVLGLLAGNVALPFLVLASTGPLVQAWFARAHPDRSPYPLYAVSNVGSLLALFVYPLVLEPRISLSLTGTLWSYSFAATGIAVLACARPMARMSAGSGLQPGSEDADGRARIGLVRPLIWCLLSGLAVVLLMGVTNKLCLDLASVPFLWTVPLALYLITFILCFASERMYRRPPFVLAAIAAFLLTRLLEPDAPIVIEAFAYGAMLFSACMILHGELYRSRPASNALTRFYLCVSAGGAIAGLLVGVAAPLVFDDYYELPLGLLLTWLMVLAVCARDPRSFLRSDGPRWRWGVAAPAMLSLVGYFAWLESRPDPQQVHKERSFFGVLAVADDPNDWARKRSLTNGTTVHGTQFQAPSTRRLPTSYYGPATGIGLVMKSRPDHAESRIGVIGLGVGTLAAYGRPGDTIRFYEIDPAVVEIASPGGYFSFLEDSNAEIELVIGDARLAIVDEQKLHVTQEFDLLILDAFTSDAIPIHLLTREAFERYFEALADDGYIAVHVSNRHFQLMSIVSRVAAACGAHSLQLRTRPIPEMQSARADWVVIARNSDQTTSLATRIEERYRALHVPPSFVSIRRAAETDLAAFPVWTDEYSDLVRALGREPEIAGWIE